MSEAVIVGVELGPERLDVCSRLGAREGPALAFDAPGEAASPDYWHSDAFNAVLQELLALLHLPRIDTLVIALAPASAAAAADVLPGRLTGEHVVRNTECRSQTLAVTVHRVIVASGSAEEAIAALAATHAKA